MLVFHPDLGTAAPDAAEDSEVIICLDCSNSMEGVTFLQAKQIALHALSLVGKRQKVNVIKFGSGECCLAWPSARPPSGSVFGVEIMDVCTLASPLEWEVAQHRVREPGPRFLRSNPSSTTY